MRNGRVPRSGFTLIELLVVCVVIAILASILLPSLSRGKELARRTKCLSHLRQYGVYLSIYLDDHGRYPPASWINGNGAGVGTVDPIGLHFSEAGRANRLVPDASWLRTWTLRCPGNKSRIYYYNVFARSLNYVPQNQEFLDLGGDPVRELPGVIPVGESRVVNPAEMIAYSEMVQWRMLPIDRNTSVPDFPRPAGETMLPVGGSLRFTPMEWPHFGGLNQLLCDGHVESVGSRAFAADSDRIRRRWFLDNLPHRELKRVPVVIPR